MNESVSPLLEECEIEIERLKMWVNAIRAKAIRGSNNEEIDDFYVIEAMCDETIKYSNCVAQFPHRSHNKPIAYLGMWPKNFDETPFKRV